MRYIFDAEEKSGDALRSECFACLWMEVVFEGISDLLEETREVYAHVMLKNSKFKL